MFEIDENNLPFVRTRHALLALDLQNDFVSASGILPVETPSDFVEKIVNLASHFRKRGDVIWIRSIFEASRPVNSADVDSESVITDKELSPDHGRHGAPKPRSRPSQKLLEAYAKIVETNGREHAGHTRAAGEEEGDQLCETYLTVEPGKSPQLVLPMSPGTNISPSVSGSVDREKDLIFQKTYYSAFKDGRLVQTLRAKFVTEIYICGALTNISVFATAMDAARHGYAITIVDDCLGYRSKARHDEALRQLTEFTGCEITSSSDLIQEFQERAKAQEPTQRRNPRAREKDSELENLMAHLNLRSGASRAPRVGAVLSGPPTNVAVVENGGSSESLDSSEPAEELKLPTKPTEAEGKKRERVKTKIKTRRRHSKSSPKDTVLVGEPTGSSAVNKGLSAVEGSPSVVEKGPSAVEKGQTSANLLAVSQIVDNIQNAVEPNPATTVPSDLLFAATSVEDLPVGMENGNDNKEIGKAVPLALNHAAEKTANLSFKDERIDLCEGDTTIINGLLDDVQAEGIFEKIRDEVRWQKMSHQGGDVPRLVAVQGEVAEDGSFPIYRHPADESPSLLPFSPLLSLIRTQVEQRLGHPVNHVLIQFYRDGTDYISEHSDKTLDILPNTFIANVSFGAQRTMVLRTKTQPKSHDALEDTEIVKPRQACRTPLPHNSMCKMGLVTNMRWLHGIRQDKRMTSEKSAAELAYGGGRISLTFRLIGTFLDKDEQKIWGQGAVAKKKEDARTVINGNMAEAERMIRAFGKENHSSEFDWKEHYGDGFDVLHISNTPKLFLSGDTVADLRVKLLLAEYEIAWSEGTLSPSFNWKNGSSSKEALPIPERLPVKFVDNDLSKSTVVGDLAIMLYLDAVYGRKPGVAVRSQIDLARQFTRFQLCADLLRKWRAVPFSVKPFRHELELWEALATEAPFIAGSTISLADYALWPILDEIHGEWGDYAHMENLAAYYKRLKELNCFLKALGLPKDAGEQKTV